MDILQELWKTRHPYDTLFLDFIKDIEIDRCYPNNIFYRKKSDLIFEYDKGNERIIIFYYINKVFNNDFKDETKLQYLLKVLFEKYFSIDVSPFNIYIFKLDEL